MVLSLEYAVCYGVSFIFLHNFFSLLLLLILKQVYQWNSSSSSYNSSIFSNIFLIIFLQRKDSYAFPVTSPSLKSLINDYSDLLPVSSIFLKFWSQLLENNSFLYCSEVDVYRTNADKFRVKLNMSSGRNKKNISVTEYLFDKHFVSVFSFYIFLYHFSHYASFHFLLAFF